MILGGIISLIFWSCSPKVIHFTNEKARFAAYETYEIVNYKSGQREISAEGVEVQSIIASELEKQMDERSYRRVSNDPELILRYELVSAQRSEVTERTSFYNFNYREYTIRTILESVILLELTDRTTGKLVWQASVDLNKYAKKDSKEEILKDAIAMLFDTYLYRAKSNRKDESLKTH
ncbi:uncharacterized protein DUF4136 [Marinoscillum furvescens DSM 4134]|uniref:Uncharacterized protein DUF4136 n=2 Tax=Marinoscillum furvescens TaxID=1026 RepID=A0A3D9KY64_MARFU|nr:uncharacterized protein DUF4136 [Marinoscillum furvescens DSM 4134]